MFNLKMPKIELPNYKPRDVVSAVQIHFVTKDDNYCYIHYFLKTGGVRVIVNSLEYYEKNQPEEGGYFIQHEDGNDSYLPTNIFNSLYEQQIEEEPKTVTGYERIGHIPPGEKIIGITSHDGRLVAATDKNVYAMDEGVFKPLQFDFVQPPEKDHKVSL